METRGEEHRELYTNHYGNSPTHCPQWKKITITMKIRTAKWAEYCTQCFAPGVIIKRNANTHFREHCKVTQTTKHKFSCLTKTCLKHSWICQDHVEENKPLLAEHHEELATLMGEPEENPNKKGTRSRAKTEHPALFLFCSIPGRNRTAVYHWNPAEFVWHQDKKGTPTSGNHWRDIRDGMRHMGMPGPEH